MYKKIIKYTDYNGVERKEPFYFNLEESDIMRYNFSVDGPNGYQSYLNRLLATQKTTEAYEIFEKFICDSYGVKSDDGKRFIKNQEVLDEFKQSRAYSELLMELISVPGAATEFFNGIMPPALLAQMNAKIKNGSIDMEEIDKMVYGSETEAPDTIISDNTNKEKNNADSDSNK